MDASPKRVRVVDSHTEGEPTRVVIAGGPDLGAGSAKERLERLRTEHDELRRALVKEPRASEAAVGALLCPATSDALTQVIFFNNTGYLSMCVHGMIGVAETLRYLGKATSGSHRVETPAGDVSFRFEGEHAISIENVLSYRHRANVTVTTERHGDVRGDIAWGGNWFFIVHEHDERLHKDRIPRLTEFASDVRHSLVRQGITGKDGREIDHVELVGPPLRKDAHAKNFVLCPGEAYDRSPCGTGTSAKVACLAADGKLAPGETLRIESIVGSSFSASYRPSAGGVLPTISGHAYVVLEGDLLIDSRDPYRAGFPE